MVKIRRITRIEYLFVSPGARTENAGFIRLNCPVRNQRAVGQSIE
jgi:hypothetical protein